MNRYIPWILLGGVVSLLQWHSYQFWAAYTGPEAILWSATIEGLGLWAWWKQKWLMGALFSLLLLFTCCWQLVEPAIISVERQAQVSAEYRRRHQQLFETLQHQRATLAVYLKNSETRIGWAQRIDAMQAAINETEKAIAKPSPEQFGKTLRFAPALMKIFTLMLLLWGEVALVRGLRAAGAGAKVQNTATSAEIEAESSRCEIATKSEIPSPRSPTGRIMIAQLAKDVQREVDELQLSRAAWARQRGVSSKDLALIFSHSEREIAGREIVSRPALARVLAALERDSRGKDSALVRC